MSSEHKPPTPRLVASLSALSAKQEPLPALISQLRGLIESARAQALRAVDAIQVRTCWEIGRHIVEFEQQGQDRATYGARLIPNLAKSLTAEFGRGFDASNLRYMRLFYLAFPIRDALRHELSWTHYRTLLRVDGERARHWYMNYIIEQAREVLIWGRLPDWIGLGKYSLAAIAVAWAGFAWFQKTRKGFADVL